MVTLYAYPWKVTRISDDDPQLVTPFARVAFRRFIKYRPRIRYKYMETVRWFLIPPPFTPSVLLNIHSELYGDWRVQACSTSGGDTRRLRMPGYKRRSGSPILHRLL